MKPRIKSTEFGSIRIGGKTYDHDIIIRLDGAVKKRKKKLSKVIYGTSHTVSLDEARHVYDKGAKLLVVGSGQNGLLSLSKEAKEYLEKKKCRIDLSPTGDAVSRWNDAKGKAIGLFHITC